MEPCSATKCVSPARTVQGGLGLYEATTPCVSEHRHSSYDEKGEQTSMGLLQPFGIPSPHTKPPFPPFPKAQHETSNSGAALHAINMRTGGARVFVQLRRRLRACTTTSMEQETARVLPERGRADGKNEEDEEQRRRRRAGGCRAFSSSPASALYITEQGSRGSGRYGG